MCLFGKQSKCQMNNKLQLPSKIFITDYNNDINEFLDAAYVIFKRDFITSKPNYNGQLVGMKKYPLELNGKEHTFYHITHEGEDECNRKPSIPRIERIAYPRFFIDNHDVDDFLVWKNIRHSEERILIYQPSERYLVVLSIRKGFVLLWTAYYVNYNHTHKKLIQEYKKFKGGV